jgi:hypothetical protein
MSDKIEFTVISKVNLALTEAKTFFCNLKILHTPYAEFPSVSLRS